MVTKYLVCHEVYIFEILTFELGTEKGDKNKSGEINRCVRVW